MDQEIIDNTLKALRGGARLYRQASRAGDENLCLVYQALMECLLTQYMPMDKVSKFCDYENVDEDKDGLYIFFKSGFHFCIPL